MKKVVYKNPYFQVIQEGSYFYLDYGRPHSGVVILAQVDAALIFIKTFRFPIKQDQRELPRGFLDQGELPTEAALRELREETGYVGTTAEILGYIAPDSGGINNQVLVVLIQVSTKEQPLDSEAKEVKLVDRQEVRQFVKDHGIIDGFTLAALWFWLD